MLNCSSNSTELVISTVGVGQRRVRRRSVSRLRLQSSDPAAYMFDSNCRCRLRIKFRQQELQRIEWKCQLHRSDMARAGH